MSRKHLLCRLKRPYSFVIWLEWTYLRLQAAIKLCFLILRRLQPLLASYSMQICPSWFCRVKFCLFLVPCRRSLASTSDLWHSLWFFPFSWFLILSFGGCSVGLPQLALPFFYYCLSNLVCAWCSWWLLPPAQVSEFPAHILVQPQFLYWTFAFSWSLLF